MTSECGEMVMVRGGGIERGCQKRRAEFVSTRLMGEVKCEDGNGIELQQNDEDMEKEL